MSNNGKVFADDLDTIRNAEIPIIKPVRVETEQPVRQIQTAVVVSQKPDKMGEIKKIANIILTVAVMCVMAILGWYIRDYQDADNMRDFVYRHAHPQQIQIMQSQRGL
jgi:hypothetical protein